MKRCPKLVVWIISILWLLSLFTIGCTQKAVVKGEESAVQKESTAGAGTVTEKGKGAEAEATQETAASAKEGIAFKDIYFEFDKFSLRPEARDIVKQLAGWLTKNKNYDALIEGNCDERGTTEYNLALGERRAKEAMKYVVELGIDGKRLRTISYGKERPLDPGHNEEAWAKNRRDHFVVTPQK
jgi:peptidoglycan-associated lipoprotein